MIDNHIQTLNGSKVPGLSEVEVFVGDTFSASDTIAGNQPLTYTWNLGDGSCPLFFKNLPQ